MRRRVVVAVPARDEEALLGRCLDAVAAARVPGGVAVTTVVALDRCTDRSADVAAARGVMALPGDFGSVGAARAAAVAAGLAAAGEPGETWICCTDADSAVPADWLEVHLALAAGGADLVRGTVHPDPAELAPGVRRRFWAEHVDRDDHPYVYGANLGVAAEAYLALGGFATARAHEDRDLVDRAYAAGLVVVSTSRAPVLTSARLDGRVSEGFAAYLAGLAGPAVAGSGHGTPA